MKISLHLIIAFPLLLAATYWQGVSTDRWGLGDDVKKAAERLEAIPLTIETSDDSGKKIVWEGTELEIDDYQLKNAEVVGYKSRIYRRTDPSSSKIQNNRSSIRVVVLCGRHGPMSVHAPTTCFPSTGLSQISKEEIFLVRNSEQSPLGEVLWCEFATKEQKDTRRSLTIWTWSTNDSIEVPDNPRRAFASRGFLYKIYVIQERLLSPGETEDFSLESDNQAVRFLQAFLPELKKALHAK